MSWEAFRWTAKSPSELYHVLGPHGVDDLVRQMIAAVWRHLPEEGRTFDAAVAAAGEVYDRNIRAWRAIKKPTPEAFFADLHPHEADGHLRKAMVVTWMMMPRTGGREVADALRIVALVYERNLAAWAEDQATFTGRGGGKPRPAARKTTKAARPKAVGTVKGRATSAPARRAAKPPAAKPAVGRGRTRAAAPAKSRRAAATAAR